jgi:hypothetical protein
VIWVAGSPAAALSSAVGLRGKLGCNSDMLWPDTTTGTVAIWLLNGLRVLQSAGLAAVGLDWTIQGLNAD